MSVATFSLPSAPTVGQLNQYRHPARIIIAQDLATNEYVEVVAWYHSEVSGLPSKEGRFTRIMDKDDAIYWGYIK